MPKFVVIIRGVNFLLRMEDPKPSLMGFYINAYLEAATFEEAEAQAIELVRTSPRLRPLVANSSADPPEMFVVEAAELIDWPDGCSRPLSGFAYYDDPDSEWRREASVT